MTIKRDNSHLSITESPMELLSELSYITTSYSTALIKITKKPDGKEIAKLIGSGTFVCSSNIYGILTAAHVTDSLHEPYSLGLILKKQEHRYVIDSKHLIINKIAKGCIDSDGPDLSFIKLPLSEIPTIEATKIFYNLDRNRERILQAPPDIYKGIWALSGVPDIETSNMSSENFNSLKVFNGQCGFGGIRKIYDVDGFDYCDFEIRYDCCTDMPDSFGGVSGGGLWQIPLLKNPDQKLEASEYILSGIAFYETQKVGISRSIKCHGRRSIYDKAYQEIVKS